MKEDFSEVTNLSQDCKDSGNNPKSIQENG